MNTQKVSKNEQNLLKLHIARPEIFCQQRLNFTPWEKQVEIMHSVRDYKETYVQSCNAAGKSQIAAAIALYWILTRKGKVLTTAPTWQQVEDILWSKIRSYAHMNPNLGLNPHKTSMTLQPEWFATGRSSRIPDNLQGYHGNVLVIVDEACGIENNDIWHALDGNVTDARNDRMLAIGNPTNPDTEFARRCGKKVTDRNQIRISAFDVPNVKENREVIPGLISKSFVEQKAEDWGTSSSYYLARILGKFPRNIGDTLYPLSWLDRAFTYEYDWKPGIADGVGAIGLDVAGAGADANSMCYRTGGKIWRLQNWQNFDTSEIVAGDEFGSSNDPFLFGWVDEHNPDVVAIDATTIGKPIYDQAKRHKRSDSKYRNLQVRPFIGKRTARRDDLYANMKAEAYFHLRGLFQHNAIDLSALDDEMKERVERQAGAIRYQPDSRGRTIIEDKKAMKKRVGFSPDDLEAMIMAMYVGGAEGAKRDVRSELGSFDYERDEDSDETIETASYNYGYNMSEV